MPYELFAVFTIATFSWFIGSLAAGGAGLIFLALSSFILPFSVLPVILGFAGFIGGGYRVYLYRSNVSIPVLTYLIPGTILGAVIGAAVFTKVVTDDLTSALEIFMGIMLITSGLLGLIKYEFTNNDQPKLFSFFIVGALTAFVSGIIGAGSPIVTKLFSKMTLTPVQIMGTISCNNFILQGVKSLSYMAILIYSKGTDTPFNLDTTSLVNLALFAAAGTVIGSILGKKVLHVINTSFFDVAVNVTLLIFGFKFLWPHMF